MWWLTRRTFDHTVGRSEGQWFDARLVSSLLYMLLTSSSV